MNFDLMKLWSGWFKISKWKKKSFNFYWLAKKNSFSLSLALIMHIEMSFMYQGHKHTFGDGRYRERETEKNHMMLCEKLIQRWKKNHFLLVKEKKKTKLTTFWALHAAALRTYRWQRYLVANKITKLSNTTY